MKDTTGFFARVNTKITRRALERLNYACEVRSRREPRPCPQGMILDELIMERLEPTPDEKAEVEKARAEKQPKRKRIKSAKRNAEAKAAAA